MKEQPASLYEYGVWVNQPLLEAAAALTAEQFTRKLLPGFGFVHLTVVHILGAEVLWFARWQELSPKTVLSPRELPTVPAIRERWAELIDERRANLAALDKAELAATVHWTNMRGQLYALPRWQVMLHCANHSTHHRSEVAAMLTELGHEPDSTDLLEYYKVGAMKVVVVYESLWGNTAAIARAIAAGIGPAARALSTAEASGAAIEDADLIVAGAPVLAFTLPSEQIRESIRVNPGKAPAPPDLSHPSMRSWLDALPKGHGRFAAFETRIWWSPGGATAAIVRALERAGYRPVAKARRFIVTGRYGPLRDGELERARLWGVELAQAMG